MDDPKAMRRWAKEMGKEMGEDLGDDFDEYMDAAESGETMRAGGTNSAYSKSRPALEVPGAFCGRK